MHILAFVVIIANCFQRRNLNNVVFSINRLCNTSIVYAEFVILTTTGKT